jgi:hypothetical protein
MHALSFHRRRLRRTVWVTLGAWVFAFCAGVANACMLAPHGSAEHGVVAASPSRADAQPHRASASSVGGQRGHDETVAQQGQEQGAGKDSCLKFCDDESSALSKNKTTAFDLGQPLLVVVAPWSPMVPSRTLGTKLSLQRPTAQGPPLAIRFLRLTL